jgi:lysophospholipase L1-like esterase
VTIELRGAADKPAISKYRQLSQPSCGGGFARRVAICGISTGTRQVNLTQECVMRKASIRTAFAVLVALVLATPASIAQSPQQFDPDVTRYMAIGDSLSAGYKAMPVTQGFVYLLYQDGVFDRVPHTLFCNAAVPGATSQDVLLYQVPQVLMPIDRGFNPKYITLTVGGNDLLAIFHFAQTHPNFADVLQFAQQVLGAYAQNLGGILFQLRTGLPNAKIFIGNQYTIREFQAVLPFTDSVIDALNGVTAQVVAQFATNVFAVNVHDAFLGRTGLLLIERHGADPTEVHLTDAGHRVMEQAFADVIQQNK